MPLSDLITPEAVIPTLRASSKKQALQELAERASAICGLPAREIYDVVLQRERLGSTGVGNGVAIPHGRIKGMKTPLAAVFSLAEPIGFDAPDEKPVSLMIFLLVPEASTQKHLEILSEIAEMLSDTNLRDKLQQCREAQELHLLITNWQSVQTA